MRFLLVALLLLIKFGTVDVASAVTPEELTRQCQKGNATGGVNLGRMYGQGKGITQDYVKAVEFYRKACDGQNAIGCYNLGVMYGQGTGVTQDDVKAVALMTACATSRYVGEYKDGIPHGEGTRTLRYAAGRL